MKSKIIFLICGLLVLEFSSGYSQTADQIIEKYLNARGGTDSLRNIKTVHLIGKIQTAGMELPVVYYWKAPDKIRFQVDLRGKSGITVFTGDSGWIVDPSTNTFLPKKLSPQEVAQKKPLISCLMVFFDNLLLNYNKNHYKVEYNGKDSSASGMSYKISIRMTDGTNVCYYIDAKNYLDYHHKVTFPDLNSTFDVSLKEFTYFNGINIPMEIESRIQDQRITKIVIEKMMLNTDLNDDLFSMPQF
jgi:outer membrane lipoprotein-sorting protein